MLGAALFGCPSDSDSEGECAPASHIEEHPLFAALRDGPSSPESLLALLPPGSACDTLISRDGESPLAVAIQNDCSASVMETLLAAGPHVADANELNLPSRSMLRFYVFATRELEVVRVLVAAGVDPCLPNVTDGNTPLHTALYAMRPLAVLHELLSAGCDASPRNIKGDTPLHVALSVCLGADVLHALLDAGADVDARNDAGDVPLATALRAGCSFKIICLLLEASADATASDALGNSLVHVALTSHKAAGLELVQTLVDAGASPSAVNAAGDSPLRVATMYNSPAEVLEVLVRAGAAVDEVHPVHGGSLLHTAATSSLRPEVFEVLVAGGADMNIVDETGNTALHEMLLHHRSGTFEASLRLVGLGASVNLANRDGKTPLMLAIEKAHQPKMLRMLLNAGSDTTMVDKDGNGLYHIAARLWSAWRLRAFSVLCECGADPNVTDAEGNNALHALLSSYESPFDSCYLERYMFFATSLAQLGARIEAKNDAGLAPLDNLCDELSPLRHELAAWSTKEGIMQLMLGLKVGRSNALTRMTLHTLYDVNAVLECVPLLTGKRVPFQSS